MTASMVAVLVTLAVSFASLIAFAAAFRRGYRDRDTARRGSPFLLGLANVLPHWFMWALGPLERTLLRAGVTPDHMNVAGLAFGLLSGVFIATGRLEAGGWAILLAGVCDVLDGRLARALHASSRYGKFIDSTFDRFVEAFAFLGFAVYFAHWPGGPLVVAAGLGGSLLVSYAQARGETVDVSGSGGLMQRAERLTLTLLGCLCDPLLSRALERPEGSVLLAILTLIAVGTFGTATYRTLWIARRLRQRPDLANVSYEELRRAVRYPAAVDDLHDELRYWLRREPAPQETWDAFKSDWPGDARQAEADVAGRSGESAMTPPRHNRLQTVARRTPA